METIGKTAKEAGAYLASLSEEEKNSLLKAIASSIDENKEEILTANREEVAAAKSAGRDPAFIDRLSLEGRLEGVIRDIYHVIALSEPLNEIYEEKELANGLRLKKQRVPLGVIGVIYEARPNVTVDVASLCIKTGNAVILRGGSETLLTNIALVKAISRRAPEGSVQLIADSDREKVKEMLKLDKYIDVIIPRGGETLHRFCRENSTIPVISGGQGVCHLFVDDDAQLEKSLAVIVNAKTQRPTVCNALDTLLVHQSAAPQFLPPLLEKLSTLGVSFNISPEVLPYVKKNYSFQPAKEADWDREWLSLVLGVKIVAGLDEAIAHIERHSSKHSDGILTENASHAKIFVKKVSSGVVYVNASTRFTDGGEFGLGAEVAISTQKLHARGPMGLKELTTYKWIVEGNYHTRGAR